MKIDSTALGVLILICLATFAAVNLRAQSDGADRPTRWQHMALTHETEKGMNDPELNRRIVQLGREGWELVDVETITADGTSIRTIFCFKRAG